MARFVYLFRGPPPANPTPEEARRMTASWMAWIDSLAKKGHIAANGDALEKPGKTVRQRGVTDGPYAEAKDLVGGFTLVEAESIEQAAELAKGCPALASPDWSVEVRPVRVLPR